MTTTRLSFLLALALLAGCDSGPKTDISAEFQMDVCAAHTVAGSPFTAAADTATAHAHALQSGATPNAIALPAGAPGYVGIHVAELHTTAMIIVKNSADVGAVTRGGATLVDSPVYDSGPVPGCADLFYFKLHFDTPADYELALPSNAAASTWLAFEIVQVGHDLVM